MKPLKEFEIPFVGLKIGKHNFEYQIDNKFFEYFEYEEFNDVNVDVNLELDKKAIEAAGCNSNLDNSWNEIM